MGFNSEIEWTTHTFNPWVGCTKIAPPCDFCYAEIWARRTGHPELWQGERRRTSPVNWRQPLKWDRSAYEAGHRDRVFCASLADVFDNQVPEEWRHDLWRLIWDTPNLDWLLLTKRPMNIKDMLPDSWGLPEWGNVWLGTTCGDAAEYDRNWRRHLSKIPARKRFISYEPALGPLGTLGPAPYPDWIICGGESGAADKARVMEQWWAEDVMERCAKLGIAFFMKQMTRRAPIPPHLMVRQFPHAA